MAGVPGFEPGLSVLETDVLTVDTLPLTGFQIVDCRFQIDRSPDVNLKSAILNLQLLSFLVISMLAATATELTKLKPIRRGLFILRRNVVAAFTSLTLKNYVISRHKSRSRPLAYGFGQWPLYS
jgi:hypothetical protein